MSLDITIKVDPGNAVAQAAKVETALGKVEKAGDGAQSSLSGIAKNVASINFKQGAAGAAQAFELLNQHLKITDSLLGNAVGSVIKFGAAGAQIAGPLGALVGAGAGALASLGEAILDSNAAIEAQNAINRKSAEAWAAQTEAAAKAKQEAREMAPVLEALAERQRIMADVTATAARVTNEWTDKFRTASSQANAYADELIRINKATGEFKFPKRFGVLGNPFAGASESQTEAERTRAMRGSEIADRRAYAAGKSYGDVLVELEEGTLKYRNRLEDLAKVSTDQNASQEVRNKAFKEYNKLVKEAADKTAKLREETVMLGGDLDSTGRVLRNVAVNRTSGAAAPQFGGVGISGSDPNVDAAMNGLKGAGQKSWLRMNVPGEIAAKGSEKSALEASLARQQEALNALEGAAKTAGDALVDAFMGADISGKELLKTITSMLAKQALGALIGAGFGALSPTKKLPGGRNGFDSMVPGGAAPFLPGFATGGDMLVGGSGGPDTKIAAFRVSPGESIHVRTPQQRDQAQASKSGGGARAVTINLNGTGRDAITEQNIEGVMFRVVERNNAAIRSRLRG